MAQTTVIEGTAVEFYTGKPFTSIGGTLVNPDVVTFKWSCQGGPTTTYTWTNPTGDPSGYITNTSTGYFQLTLPTLGFPGLWTWQWACYPSSGDDTTKTTVVTEGTLLVSAKSL